MRNINSTLGVCCILLLLFACNKPEEQGDTVNPTNETFVLSVVPGNHLFDRYLLFAGNLDTGLLTRDNNYISEDSVRSYYTPRENKVFNMLLGYGSPWSKPTFTPDGFNRLVSLDGSNFSFAYQAVRVGDKILLAGEDFIAGPNSVYTRGVNWCIADADGTVKETFFKTSDLLHNNGSVWVNGMQVAGGKVFASLTSLRNGEKWITDYPDSAWVAVFSWPDMKLEKIAGDGRTSAIGLNYTSGFTVTETGDLYAFSPASTIGVNGKYNSTKSPAVTRIKSGATDFDPSYYFDIGKVSGGAFIHSWTYAANGYVLAGMATKNTAGNPEMPDRLAAIDLAKREFRWVSGLPAGETVTRISDTNHSQDNGIVYVAVSTTDKKSTIYKVNVFSATASKGAVINDDEITGVYGFPAK